jgi:hypothetical protein
MAKEADIAKADAEFICKELRRRGLLKSYVLEKSRQAIDFVTYLADFWDWAKSSYIKEKLRRNHGKALGEITRQDIEAFIAYLESLPEKAAKEQAEIKNSRSQLAPVQRKIIFNPHKTLIFGILRTTIVISDKTTIPSLRRDKTFDENMESSLKYVNEKIGEEYNALFLDFKKNNENDYSLTEYITKSNKAISNDLVRLAIGDVGPTEYWSKFYELNPNACGRVTFSRIGFKDNNAFIEVQFIKGSMDGFIDYIILENSGDNWEVVKSNRHVYY